MHIVIIGHIQSDFMTETCGLRSVIHFINHKVHEVRFPGKNSDKIVMSRFWIVFTDKWNLFNQKRYSELLKSSRNICTVERLFVFFFILFSSNDKYPITKLLFLFL